MYPTATIPERFADGVMHIIGVAGAIYGTVYLLNIGTLTPQLGIYGASLIVAFLASAVYNMIPYDGPRPMLRRFDHAMIYALIAGTYTPLVFMLDTKTGYAILTIVWTLAIIGVIRKLFFWQHPGKFGTVLYLVMGWLSPILIYQLTGRAPQNMIWLIAAGGLIYTLGVPVYLAKKMPFSTAIWHGLVVVASACFLAAIAIGAQNIQ
ncbi:MAG: hemolysin III family protein [Yoonia sp.]|jgi:hemolysin III|nr:hemolysin III family protein [Yoonia sp.]